jgi:hypothetical protein
MPTRRLPAQPNLDQLKHQAKDLFRARERGELQACQRIREFHPRYSGATDAEIRAAAFTSSDAHLAIAREYGFASWARLRTVVLERLGVAEVPHHERIEDAEFRRAVELLDDGDVDGLRRQLAAHPRVVTQRVSLEGGNYFRNPSLLEFVAENPVRHESLPPNIVEIARTILEAGARGDRAAVEGALALVVSGRVPRECGVQRPLIDLLCDAGAAPGSALVAALGQGEFDAAQALIARGARVDLPAAAALGHLERARTALEHASPDERHRALAWAAQFGRVEILRLLLDAGEDPNRFNPEGAHSHSTPLHQAALAGHEAAVRLLVERGARADVEDILFKGTPREWAEHGGKTEIAAFLRGLERP